MQQEEFKEALDESVNALLRYIPKSIDDMILLSGMCATAREQQRQLKQMETLAEQVHEEVQERKRQEQELLAQQEHENKSTIV